MSKPISLKKTDLLYINDLKQSATSESKQRRVLRSVKDDMECVGLKWNENNCAVEHVNIGCLIQGQRTWRLTMVKAISSLEEGCCYTFLGVLETMKHEDRIVPQNAAKVYFQSLSIIWSIPLTDYHRVAASKQYALPVLTYSRGPRHDHLPTYSS